MTNEDIVELAKQMDLKVKDFKSQNSKNFALDVMKSICMAFNTGSKVAVLLPGDQSLMDEISPMLRSLGIEVTPVYRINFANCKSAK